MGLTADELAYYRQTQLEHLPELATRRRRHYHRDATGAVERATAEANEDEAGYVRVPAGTIGQIGPHIVTADTAALSITGDLDIRAAYTMADWSPLNAAKAAVSKWGRASTAGGDYLAYIAYLVVGGFPALAWTTGGTVATQVAVISTIALPFADGALGLWRVALNVDNGAGLWVVTFYRKATTAATAAADAASDDGWTVHETLTGAGPTRIADTPAAVALGNVAYHISAPAEGLAINGRVYAAVIRKRRGGFLTVPAGQNCAQTPDTAALSIAGDFDGRFAHTAARWARGGGEPLTGAAKWGLLAAEQSFFAYINDEGRPAFSWVPTGPLVQINHVATKPVPFADGELGLWRAAFDADNGAGGATATFWTKATTPETAAADALSDDDWVQLGDPVTVATAVHTIADGTGPLMVGGVNYATVIAIEGNLYASVLKSAGAVVAVADFTQQDVAPFGDGYGNMWSLFGAATLNPATWATVAAPDFIRAQEMPLEELGNSWALAAGATFSSGPNLLEVPARIGLASQTELRQTFGDRWASDPRHVVTVPWDADVVVEDEVTIDGAAYVVVGHLNPSSWETARRLAVVEA